ncbi:MAG: GNAT family N-acetyltransferase [Spirochaetaceae bacterium]|nr:GNAT family N-acetyltransferase [Spirochaetaceae bacterium]
MSWTFAQNADAEEVQAFLQQREWECASLTGRLKHGAAVRIPAAATARLALRRENGAIRQVLYMSKNGFLIPYLPGLAPMDAEEALALREIFFAAGGTLTILVGLTRYTEIFALWTNLRPMVSLDYYLMKADTLPPQENFAEAPRLEIRRAREKDFRALYPLQEAYEREELLINQSDFDSDKTRKELKLMLRNHLVYCASCGATIIAKGGTNARGFTCDQIGGVFTLPEFRGRKVARLLMRRLLCAIFAESKMACLFVKKRNLPALRLYGSLGFRIVENYRISYF